MRKPMRTFPIQAGYADPVTGEVPFQGSVPWPVAEVAYVAYKRRFGTSQSLERLAERGGFGWTELVWLLRGGREEERGVCLSTYGQALQECADALPTVDLSACDKLRRG